MADPTMSSRGTIQHKERGGRYWCCCYCGAGNRSVNQVRCGCCRVRFRGAVGAAVVVVVVISLLVVVVVGGGVVAASRRTWLIETEGVASGASRQ